MQSGRPRYWSLAITFACACMALIVHFTLTLAFVLPANPVTVPYLHVATTYMKPVFSQNWRLFAPNPPYESKSLLVGCHVRHEDGREEQHPPVDVSARYLEMAAANRITPASYLMRAQTGPLPILFPPKDDLQRRVEDAEHDPHLDEVRKGFEERQETLRQKGLTMMGRVASAECRRLHPRQQIIAVRPVVVFESVPKFSQRHMENAPTKRRALDIGALPYVQVESL